ncbi:unnamed protein product [Pocillopora meandrina]|uniref:Replication factor A protein 3 n=1 Tax=Pocillopora meandrina TaxID=46732 RepID=A0AAU9Y5B4_9CNID|nr:unnamed protein product [Pocillopora meandrina]CAH3168477.1 unnamed protein product [Pocillopora meandrina]
MLKTVAPGQLITVKAKVTALREAKTLQTSRGTLKMIEGQIVDPQGGTTITATEPHANILALAPTFTVSDDSMTTSVEGSVAGVISTSMYIACNKCNKKIQNDNSSEIITCNYCNMQQLAGLCPTQYYAQFFFLTTPKKDRLTLTLFNKVI